MAEQDYRPEWDFEDMIKRMKRWSFRSKMIVAENYSRLLLNPSIRWDGSLRNYVLPEEIETFVMLAVNLREWKNDEIRKMDFLKCVEAIRNYKHPKLIQHKGEDLPNWLMMVLSATQFDFQKNPWGRISRYLHHFCYKNEAVNMNEEFISKFGISYEEMIAPIITLWLLFTPELEVANTTEIMEWMSQEYRSSFELLSLTREEYIKKTDRITQDVHDYRYCLRPSYSWPFIKYAGKLFLPTPHLLVRAITDSLMFRLTDGNNRLRELIGRHVFEDYLYKLINNCQEFIDVFPEQQYAKGEKTLDVLASTEDLIICFESKALTPQTSIRVFSQEGYEETKRREAEAVAQAYKHIHDKYGNDYNYFSVPLRSDKSNIYAVVVVEDYIYDSLENLYTAAARQLGIKKSTEEYNWLCEHVGIVSIDLLEMRVACPGSIVNEIKKRKEKNQYDYWFVNSYSYDTPRKKYSDEKAINKLIEGVLQRMELEQITMRRA